MGLPFRRAEFDILFGYGVDDENSVIDWLEKSKAIAEAEAKGYRSQVKKARDNNDVATLQQVAGPLRLRAKSEWDMIEEALAPKMSKYGSNAPVILTAAEEQFATDASKPTIPLRRS